LRALRAQLIQDRPVIEGVDSPVLTAQQLVPVCTSANATAQERFTWKSANHGAVEVVYTVEEQTRECV
jgi:hypothetical protein